MSSKPETGQTGADGTDGLDQVPVTELANALSVDIDIATPEGIANTLFACDQEIFEGWKSSSGLRDTKVIDKIVKVAEAISNVIQKPRDGCVVISGCGTSGRLAYLTARRFNKYLKSQGKEECFKYIISGGNDALFSSVELAEDDPNEGANRLKEVVEGKTRVVYIGVTCGLSAPFVAGQLDMCLSDLDTFTPVVLGFNATHQARKIVMKHLNKTFQEVVDDMVRAEQEGRAFILNPIVGPEPVAGSSRMKSGSTTKIVLEILGLLGAVNRHRPLTASGLVDMYRDVCQTVYRQAEPLGALIEMAGDSLKSGGHLYYLGRDGLGLMGIIDASECRPTYGASFHDVRGFVSGGIDGLDGEPISSTLSSDQFDREILPNLGANDTVIVFGTDMLQRVNALLFSSPCKRAFLDFTSGKETLISSNDRNETAKFDLEISIDLSSAISSLSSTCELQEKTSANAKGEPSPSVPEIETLLRPLLTHLAREIAMKWSVNCASTGAYIQLGKVFKNLMVDVRVSNDKLFHRAYGIVRDICNIEQADSRICLLKSIYSTDNLTDAQVSARVVDHVLAASDIDKVVPTAILLGLSRCSVQQARSLLEAQPNLSKVLKDLQTKALP